jgi:HemY protein
VIRLLAGAVVVLAVAGVLGALVARDPGYVLIAWQSYSLETSVWVAIVLLGVLLLLARFVSGLVGSLVGSRTGLRTWNRQRLERRAQRRTTAAFLALAEGDFAKARSVLLRSAERVETPVLNYLGAARAAHELRDDEGRDRHLQQALDCTPRAARAVALTQAELQISRRHWEQALATLLSLRKEAPRNLHVLRMLRTTYLALEDWRALAELVPELRRAEAIDADDIEVLERRVWRSEMARVARMEGDRDARVAALEQVWERMPKTLKREPELVEAFARELLGLKADDTAEGVLRHSLRRDWHESLVALYGRIPASDAQKQLVAAQSWLSERPNSEVLLLTLGRLALRTHQWARAREYFEGSIRLQKTAEGYGELARLCARLGEHERAAELYGECVRLQRDLLPDLPLPPAKAEHRAGQAVAPQTT